MLEMTIPPIIEAVRPGETQEAFLNGRVGLLKSAIRAGRNQLYKAGIRLRRR
jgi:hypothetical protein